MQAGDSKMFLGETAAQQIVKRGTLKIRKKNTHTTIDATKPIITKFLLCNC